MHPTNRISLNVFRRMDERGKQAVTLSLMSGLFWFAWAFGCYQTVYLQSVGFSASQLGLLNAISSCVSIGAVPFWGMVSDRIGSLRKVLIIILIAAAVLYGSAPLIPIGPLLLVFFPFVNFFRGPTSTFSENLLVRNTNELGLNFGMLRSTGSILFTVGSLIISALLPRVGVKNTFWMCGLLMIPVMILVIRSREPKAAPKKTGDKKEKLDVGQLFRNRAYLMFLLFAFVFYIAAVCEGSFVPYFMKARGISSERYGIVLGYRGLLEVPFLLLMVKLRRRFPLRNLIAAGALLMGLECVGFALFAHSLPVMLIFCTFFGLGNGLFIGSSLNYLYELAPDNLKASAQAFFAATSSVAGILGNLLGGVVFDAVSETKFYLGIFFIYALSVVIFILSRHAKPTKTE